MKKLMLASLTMVLSLVLIGTVWGQDMGTGFTHQGRLMDGGAAANGEYDLEFKLFDDPNVGMGNQVGTTVTKEDVKVYDGYFAVTLNFGGVFDGRALWLEKGVRPGSSSGDFSTLSPRIEVPPTPYAVYAAKSGWSNQSDWNNLINLPGGFADGIDDNNIYMEGNMILFVKGNRITHADTSGQGSVDNADGVVLQDVGLDTAGHVTSLVSLNFDSRYFTESELATGGGGGQVHWDNLVSLPAGFADGVDDVGSGDFDWIVAEPNMYAGVTGNIGIGTSSPSEKLDVLGNININSVYKIAGETVLSNSGNQNIMVGIGAGANNTENNSTFVGNGAGYNNQGRYVTILGNSAGINNTGGGNVFLGYRSGFGNTTGQYNTFLGTASGSYNTTGSNNTYLGKSAGLGNQTGSRNVFLGSSAGYFETGSDKLYIDNSDTTLPLIYGDFATDQIGLGTSSPHADAKLHVASSELYSGYFTSDLNNNNTHVIHAEYTGTGNYNARAVYGKSVPADEYGYGGWFEGGNTGVYGKVNPTGNQTYLGAVGSVNGGSGTNTGVLGYSNGTGTKYGVYGHATGLGTNYGVYGRSSGGGGSTNYAGYFSGNLIVHDGGRVGIATTTPTQTLDVNGYVTAAAYFDRNDNNYYTDPAGTSVYNSLQAHDFFDHDNVNYYVDPAATGTSALFAGDVGIGTTSPEGKLHVAGGDIVLGDNKIQNTNNRSVYMAGTVYLTPFGGGDIAYLQARRGDDSGSTELRIRTVNAGILTEAVHITGTGNVGIGTTSPGCRVDIEDTSTSYLARIKNNDTSVSADVLALQVGTTGNPSSGNDFIKFLNGSGTLLGQIEGNGAGGVSFGSSASDFAEWLERREVNEKMEAGDIVGVFGGEITHQTEGAEQVMVVSTAPVVLGNSPEEEKEGLYEKVAFLGQAPVKVVGKVNQGDFIIASGKADGAGIAVSAEDIKADQYLQIVGRAWESSDEPGLKKINISVGLQSSNGPVKRILEENCKTIQGLEEEVAEMKLLVSSLLERVGDLERN